MTEDKNEDNIKTKEGDNKIKKMTIRQKEDDNKIKRRRQYDKNQTTIR